MDQTPAQPIARLVARGVLDAELAGLLGVLVRERVPVVVASAPGAHRDAFVDALLGLLPAPVRAIELAGTAEEFDWLPEATELGWRRERHLVAATGRDGVPRASSSDTVLVARELAGHGPNAIAGPRARIAVRSLALGYGLVAAIDQADLEAVLNRLHADDIATDEDERSRLGVVIALAEVARGPRVLAAHYLQPLARDQHGHVQRLSPAVLATWSMTTDRWDHFAWGVTAELAARIGVRPIDLEREQARLEAAIRSEAAEVGATG